MRKRIGIVIVSYGNEADVLKLIRGVSSQMTSEDRLIVVDNMKPYKLKGYLGRNGIAPDVHTHDNGGFGAGCNYGAAKIINEVDMLLFLNPDTYMVQSDYIETMRLGYDNFDAWQSLLVMPNERIHNAGNNVHITGITWSDRYNQHVPENRMTMSITNVSGGAMAVKADWWRKVGGFNEAYFMYFEDVDFSTVILQSGGKLGLLPQAVIGHNYEFEKGGYKWFYLERNRQIYMLANWPVRLIIVTLLPNLVFNVAIFLEYCLARRPMLKLKADWGFLKAVPYAVRLRRKRMGLRKLPSRDFYKTLSYSMDSELLGGAVNNRIVNALMRTYYRFVGLFFI